MWWIYSWKTELPPKYSRMTTMSEVFLWNYPGLWNCILMCILRWYSFRFFQVQFSHKIFSVFNQIFLFSYSTIPCWFLETFFNSTVQLILSNIQPVSSQKVPFPQFGFTCLVLAYILWVLWQTLIYFRIYRKFCICNIIGDFPTNCGLIIPQNRVVLRDFRPKFGKKSAGLCCSTTTLSLSQFPAGRLLVFSALFTFKYIFVWI